MALVSLYFSVCVMMVYLPGAARLSDGGKISCPCPQIPQRNLTKPPPSDACYQAGDHYRYQCIEGYIRKIGTSNIIKCNGTHWSTYRLTCEAYPKRTTTQSTTTQSTTTQSTTALTGKISCPCPQIPQRNLTKPPPSDACYQAGDHYRYNCIEGYITKIGTSNIIRCNGTHWSTYRLTCEAYPKRTTTQSTTTTVTASSTTQMRKSMSTLSSETGDTKEPTTQALTTYMTESERTSSSGTGQSGTREPTTHDFMRQTAVKTKTTQNSSLTTMTPLYYNISSPAPINDILKPVMIGSVFIVLLVIVCALAGIRFFLGKRSSKTMILVQPAEELKPLKRQEENP